MHKQKTNHSVIRQRMQKVNSVNIVIEVINEDY